MKSLSDVAYGNHERHKLDVYFPDTKAFPLPAVIYFHGGGYVNGDKKTGIRAGLLEDILEAGIAFISCNYRFITETPFPAPMNDATRAIQFVRYKAKEWNIDPERIALSGGSAGAHMSLWNAFKGDLAKPDSADPVERESSSVCAAVVFESQISKDQHFYKQHYLGDKIQPNIALFYGINDVEELESPEIRKLSYEASAINYLTAQAPPVLTIYSQPFTDPIIPADAGDIVHHPIHGYLLKKRMDELGIRCVFRHGLDPLKEGEIVEFLQDAFQ